MNNVELFYNFYKENKVKLECVISDYNKLLIDGKNSYLNKNLQLFANLNSDGKLIRGILVNLGYEMIKNQSSDYSMPLALAYEIFQTSVLIHDDIIDNDSHRRGKETIHYSNYKDYSKYGEDFAKKTSESVAICMGDYGFYEANQVIVKNYSKDLKLGDVLTYYNDVILKTIEGELYDVMTAFDGKSNLIDAKELEENIIHIYKLKTAYYTIIGPLCLGMILAGTSNEKISDITNFGEKVGIAYQIQDDILGIYSDNMGKVVGSDIKEFKQTILYSYIYENSKEYLDELLKYYGKNDITETDIEKVREIFNESGAYNYAYSYMNNLYNEGLSLLDNISWISEEYKNILKGFVMYLKERNK